MPFRFACCLMFSDSLTTLMLLMLSKFDLVRCRFQKPGSIFEREDDYRRRRLQRVISPDRNDAFAMGDKTPDARVRSYADIMKEQQLQRETENTMRNISDKKKLEAEAASAMASSAQQTVAAAAAAAAVGDKRRKRWDSTEPAGAECVRLG